MSKVFSEKKKGITTIKLVYCAMLIAISAIGSMIKVSGTIAFDSMPGFFAALFLSPPLGALVAGAGHILTALTSGFPMTLPMHMLLMILMAIAAYLFGIIYKKANGILACIVGIILNGPAILFISAQFASIIGLPLNGWAMFNTLILPLTIASAANVILGYVIYTVLNVRKRN
ncbi:ECF transporter S component [Clostridium sp. D2Q-14]|uniref:ECF transporter S component n=1 Tax=Anaeromonas gelatinilytica TaxID=2683194 RepID=UPI00193B26C1|nr:ECF transporter S component [Anaeromonas gelatinilytica]MBS4535493.1 ECF transporter S component [Anaeromonas gelatinilytica]